MPSTTEKNESLRNRPDPSAIMQTGMGFWASKTLLAAVKTGLFTKLAGKKLPGNAIKEGLGLKATERHVYDWLDVLVSLGFLQREGLFDEALYSNAADSDLFLDRNKPSYIGGILEMANNRLYEFWGSLEEALITGKPQNEAKSSGNMDFFIELYKDKGKLQEFMDAMSGIQKGNFITLVKKFDFSRYKTFADIGGADAALSIQICMNYPDIQCTTFDLPPVIPLAEQKAAQLNLSNRITAIGGDFMHDPIPTAEVISMGNILHGLDENGKKELIKKVYNALPEGGAFIAIENIIDDDRRKNTFGLLMSLNMLIENGDAFDYSFNDFQKWTKSAGFRRQELIPLEGPASAAVAYK